MKSRDQSVRRKITTIATLMAVVAGTMVTTGCLSARTANRVTFALEREIPELELERQFALTLGRVGLAVTRMAMRFADDDLEEEERELLRGIRRAEVGIYEVGKGFPRDAEPKLAALSSKFNRQGWYSIIEVRDDGSRTWVFSKESSEGDLRGLLVIAFEADELVVVRLDGRLQAALERIARDDPRGLAGVLSSSTDA